VDEPLIVNIADAPAVCHPHRSTSIDFEPPGVEWPDTGINVQLLAPGQPNCKYHSEPVQEDFLVLHGDCIAIVNGPSAVLMIGSRRLDEAFYPVDAVAARYTASVQRETSDPAAAYAEWRRVPRRPTENPWPL
jgi:hypothetical protein